MKLSRYSRQSFKRPGIPVSAAAASALAAIATLALLGLTGASAALGLVLGSANGFVTERTVESPFGFRTASMMRLFVITLVAFGVALGFGQTRQLPGFLLGVAASQLILAGVAAWSLTRR